MNGKELKKRETHNFYATSPDPCRGGYQYCSAGTVYIYNLINEYEFIVIKQITNMLLIFYSNSNLLSHFIGKWDLYKECWKLYVERHLQCKEC